MPDFPALAVTQPNAMTNLGTLMGVAQGAQNLQLQRQELQSKGIALQQSEMDLQERNNLRGLSQNLQKYVGEDGNLDGVKLLKDATTISPKYGAEFAKQFAASHVEATAAKSAVLGLDEAKRTAVAKALSATGGMKPEQVGPFLDLIGKQNPSLVPLINISKQHLAQTAGDPKKQMEMATRIGESVLSLPEQAGVETGTRASTGQVLGQTSPRAAVLGNAGDIQMQPPPTATVYSPERQATGMYGTQPGASVADQAFGRQPQQPMTVVGSTPTAELNLRNVRPEALAEAAAKDPQIAKALQEAGVTLPQRPNPARGFIQTEPALAERTSEENKAKVVLDHFSVLAGNVANSALLEGIAQNIKTFAPKAIVGTEQEKLAFVNGILDQLGVSERATSLKSATDLLEKNMAQLAKNSPAATDAARVVNQLASPHPTMNKEAIKEAADQIIGQLRMSKDLYRTFMPKVGNRNAYLEHLGKVGEFTDARVWQFEAASKEDRVTMLRKMAPEDRVSFEKKIKQAEAAGFFK